MIPLLFLLLLYIHLPLFYKLQFQGNIQQSRLEYLYHKLVVLLPGIFRLAEIRQVFFFVKSPPAIDTSPYAVAVAHLEGVLAAEAQEDLVGERGALRRGR